jgi:hypothetical protein
MTATSIGREIVKQEQRGKRRAGYGERLITSLSAQITREFGSGYSVNKLEHFRNFYITYPNLVTTPMSHAPRGELLIIEKPDHSGTRAFTEARWDSPKVVFACEQSWKRLLHTCHLL